MKKLNPVEFGKFILAALSGLVAGATLNGCSGPDNAAATGSGKAASGGGGTPVQSASIVEMHVCKGLNACKGQGADGKNACAGQGGCAAANAKHECKGHNTCKGQGGCGEMAGKNECKGHGGCQVPMKDQDAWKKARENFEDQMKAENKPVGAAPAA
jgi:hypothetical protein